jgi:hypothetical protein
VTIASASDRDPAVFNDMFLSGVSNLRLEGVKFDYVRGRSATSKPFTIERADKLVIADSTFEGQLSSGYGTGFALRLRNSSNVTVEDNDVGQPLQRLFGFSKVQGLTMRGNEISGHRQRLRDLRRGAQGADREERDARA